MRTWLFPALTVALAVGAWAARARGTEAPSWRLEWDAPASCPDAASVRRSIARLLGGGGDAGAPLGARVVVARASLGGWHGELATTQGGVTARRSFDGTTCKDVADATALVVALMIEPRAASPIAPFAPSPAPSSGAGSAPVAEPPSGISTREDASSPATQAPAAGASTNAPPPPGAFAPDSTKSTPTSPHAKEQPTAPARRRELGGFALAEVRGGLGTLPALGFGVGLGGGLDYRRLRLRVEGVYWPLADTRLAELPSADVRVDLIAADASICGALLRTAALSAGPCASFEAGRMHARVTGVTSPSSGDSLWMAATAGGYASLLVVGPFAVALDLNALVPVSSVRFQIQGLGVAYQPAQVEGRATLSGEVRF